MISNVFKMDDIDRSIMQLVQEEPNLTHTQIAKKVNRSQPTVGMRIKKLEELGVLKFQAGINIKDSDLYFANVEIQTTDPESIIDIVNICPFMINAFRLSGTYNMSILIAAFEIQDLDKIINCHIRSKTYVSRISINIITDVINNFVLPIDLDFNKCNCSLTDHCYTNFKE